MDVGTTINKLTLRVTHLDFHAESFAEEKILSVLFETLANPSRTLCILEDVGDEGHKRVVGMFKFAEPDLKDQS